MAEQQQMCVKTLVGVVYVHINSKHRSLLKG